MTALRTAFETFATDLGSLYGDRLAGAYVRDRGTRGGSWSLMAGYPFAEVVVLMGEVRPGREIDRLLNPVMATLERDGFFFITVPVDATTFDRGEQPSLRDVRDDGYPLADAPVTGDVPLAMVSDAGPLVVDESNERLARAHLDSARTLLAHGGVERTPAEALAGVDDLAGTAWFGRALGRAKRRTTHPDPDGWVRIAAAAGVGAADAALNARGLEVWGDWHSKRGSVVAFACVLGGDASVPRDAVSGLVRLVLMDRQVHLFDEIYSFPDGEEDRVGTEGARRFTEEEADDALRIARELVDGLAPLVEELG